MNLPQVQGSSLEQRPDDVSCTLFTDGQLLIDAYHVNLTAIFQEIRQHFSLLSLWLSGQLPRYQVAFYSGKPQITSLNSTACFK